nr:hypothetical protein [Streptomyces sp. SID2888]
MGGGVVGTYVHAYDVPRRQSYQPIPSGRAGQTPSGGSSPTPIYDALYTEYVKAFRTCPGDRSGEEDMGFTAFALTAHDTGSYGVGGYGTRHGAPPHGTGHLTAQHGHTHLAGNGWQLVAQHTTGMHPVAALPPAPRRGL